MKKLMRNDPCWCGSKKPYCECHMDFDKKIEMYRKKFHKVPPRSIIKNEEQLQGMRESSKINIAVLDYVAENIKVGMTTQEIDEMVYEKTTAMGGIPAPLNYCYIFTSAIPVHYHYISTSTIPANYQLLLYILIFTLLL